VNLAEFMDRFVYTPGRRYSPSDLSSTGGDVVGEHREHGLATYHGVTAMCQEFRCDCGGVISVRLEPRQATLRGLSGPERFRAAGPVLWRTPGQRSRRS
jgi:hypothetical protein